MSQRGKSATPIRGRTRSGQTPTTSRKPSPVRAKDPSLICALSPHLFEIESLRDAFYNNTAEEWQICPNQQPCPNRYDVVFTGKLPENWSRKIKTSQELVIRGNIERTTEASSQQPTEAEEEPKEEPSSAPPDPPSPPAGEPSTPPQQPKLESPSPVPD